MNPEGTDKPFFDKFKDLEKKLKEATDAFEQIKHDSFVKEKKEELLHDQYDDLKTVNQELIKKLKEKEIAFSELEEKYQEIMTKYKELKQNEMIASDMIDDAEKQVQTIHQERENLKGELEKIQTESKEKEMEKQLLEEMVSMEEKEKHVMTKKYYKTIIVSAIAIAVVVGVYSMLFAELAGQQYKVEIQPQTTGYTIQNLRGDTIDTYLSWRLVEGDVITVNILNAERVSPEQLEIVKKTILSEEELEIDNSLLHKGPKGTTSIMYVGWQGAMKEAAKTDTKLYIPARFEVIESNNGEGDITIELTKQRNGDGFSGWTNSIADESQNQILKSRITIFAVDTLSNAELETVVRHELGHALGLAHSTAPEDLMYPTIETAFPYISECDIDAIEALYDGGNTSEVVCQS